MVMKIWVICDHLNLVSCIFIKFSSNVIILKIKMFSALGSKRNFFFLKNV